MLGVRFYEDEEHSVLCNGVSIADIRRYQLVGLISIRMIMRHVGIMPLPLLMSSVALLPRTALDSFVPRRLYYV